MASAPPAIDVHVAPQDLALQLRADVLEGLRATPKALPPKWFYDERGSRLFEQITRLPEYYPTRRERAILREQAAAIAHSTGAETLIELGSGTSEKTRLLLDALTTADTLRRFTPFDVSEPTLRNAAATLHGEYPDVEIHAVVGDFERDLACLPAGDRRLVAFLGGTIGNLDPEKRAGFLAELGEHLHPGDALLLGTDLVKDPARIVQAYDDPTGVTAEFNRNVLHVLNRELGADFAPERFDHVACYDRRHEWVEMRLRSTTDQVVEVRELGLVVEFAEAEEMRTEISAKFRREGVEAEMAAAGLRLAEWWTDIHGDFALSLSFPA